MSQKDNLLHVIMVKKDGELRCVLNGEEIKHTEFLKALQENQRVGVLLEAYKDDGTNMQLAKIHACIRKVSIETGILFRSLKKQIKRDTGLAWTTQEKEEIFKSFSDCSVEELGLVIEQIIEIGEAVNINFRGVFPEYHRGI